MVRIPEYQRQEEAANIPVGVQISPGILAQKEQAGAELAHAAKQLFTTVDEQFKSAERTNTILNEQNAMMDYFFKLEDEAKTKPPEQQVGWFQGKVKEYQSGVRQRVSDTTALKQIDHYLMSHAESGMYRVRDEYRKKVASDGIATVEAGDTTLTTNLLRYRDQPQFIYQELGKRFNAWDELVKSGHVTSAVAQQKKEALGNMVDYTRGRMEMEKNPYNALSMLNDPNQFPNLDTNNRMTLVNAAQAEITRAEALKRQEMREARMERAAQYGLLKQDAMFAIKELDEKGGVPKDYDNIIASVSRYQDLDGGRLLKRLQDGRHASVQLIEFKGKDYQTQQTEVTNELSRYQSGQMEAREMAVFERKAKMFDDLTNARASGDLLSYARKYNTMKIVPMDLNNPDTIKDRALQVEKLRTEHGLEPNLLLPEEVKAFTGVFKTGSSNDQRAYTQVLQELTGNNPSKMQKVLKQLHEKDSSIADEVGFMLSGDKESADLMARGRKRIESNPSFLGDTDKTLDAKINQVVDEMKINVIDPNQTMRRQVVQGIRNMYFGMAKETITGTDDTLIKDATDKYFGGRIVEVNGQKTVPFMKGEDSMGHQAIWNWMQPGDLAAAGNGQMPRVTLGTNSRELTISEVKQKGTLIPWENGTYVLGFKNKPSFWNKEEIVLATDAHGKPYTLDMSKVAPTIKANMTRNIKELMDNIDGELGMK